MGRVRKIWWTAVLAGAALLLSAGCSSGGGKSSAPTSVAASASTNVPVATSAPAATGTAGLSGTWSGDYQQTSPSASTGTFTIRWQQSGSSLTGTITIPGACPDGCPISATVNGSNVSFGLVAAGAINYTGTVTGSTMAGTYAAVTGSSKGTWKATKTG